MTLSINVMGNKMDQKIESEQFCRIITFKSASTIAGFPNDVAKAKSDRFPR